MVRSWYKKKSEIYATIMRRYYELRDMYNIPSHDFV